MDLLGNRDIACADIQQEIPGLGRFEDRVGDSGDVCRPTMIQSTVQSCEDPLTLIPSHPCFSGWRRGMRAQ
jgi:hypothetical protein